MNRSISVAMGKTTDVTPYTVYGIQYLPDKKRERGENFKRTPRRKPSFTRKRSKSEDSFRSKIRSKTKTSTHSRNGHVPKDLPSETYLPSTKDDSPIQSEPSSVVTGSESPLSSSRPVFTLSEDNESCDNHHSKPISTEGENNIENHSALDTEVKEQRTSDVTHGLNNNTNCSGNNTEDAHFPKGTGCDSGSRKSQTLTLEEDIWLKYPFPYENVVLSGGGSKGYAYIGALKALQDCGVLSRVRRVAGSSAGAICGGLLAVGCTPQEIADVFFCNVKWLFQDQTCSCCFFLPKMWKRFGINPGVRFQEIYGEHLAKKVGNPDITFMELYKDYGREFCVAVTNVSRMCSEYCHWTTTPDLPIRKAVRISMSFPVVYEAMKTNLFGQEHLYIDGGTLDQYPIHCFDGPELELNHNLETGRNKVMNEKSIGVYLVSETPVDHKIWKCLFGVSLSSFPPYCPNTKKAKSRIKDEAKRRKKKDGNFDVKKFMEDINSSKVSIGGREEWKHFERGDRDQVDINNLGHYVKASLSTVLVSQRRLHVKPSDVQRTVPVNCGYIGTSDYDIEPGDREFMIRCGYEHTKNFLKNYIEEQSKKMSSAEPSTATMRTSSSFQVPRSVSQYSRGGAMSRSVSAMSHVSRETEV